MKNKKRILTNFIISLIALFIWITNSLFAIEPILLSEDKGKYPIGSYLEILEDKEGNLTIDDIRKPEMENLWVRSKSENPSFGYSKSAYWARFSLESQSTKEYYLEVEYSLLDNIDFYTYSNEGNLIHKRSGDLLPFTQRDIDYRNFIFIIATENNSKKENYIRIQSKGTVVIPLILWTPKVFLEKKNTELLVFGVYFGALLVMALYNLFIWVSVKDNSYLFYVCFIITSILYFSNAHGFTFQYFWFGSPELYNQVFSSLTLFPIAFAAIFFSAKYLQIKHNLPSFYISYRILLLSSGVGFLVSPFVSYRLGSIAGVMNFIIASFWMLTLGIIMVRKKYRPAKLYLLSWCVLLLGFILSLLPVLGLTPKNDYIQYSPMFGSVVEVILLSLGLADRINELKKEKEQAQAESLANQRLAIENLEKANRVKDDFLANLSHELNTPLTIVYGYSEMLNLGKDYPEEVRDYSREIHESAEKLNDYVHDLMLMTYMESNLKVVKSNVSISQLVSTAIKQNTNLIDKKQIQLALNTFDDLELYGDKILLEKSISAVLKNAIIYNKQSGLVNILVRKRDLKTLNHTYYGIEIKISDTGIGIAEEFHQKIFEKFFRIDSSLTYEVSGVGVGLYIARKIVEIHGGSLEMKSELGIGSEFTISLPVSK